MRYRVNSQRTFVFFSRFFPGLVILGTIPIFTWWTFYFVCSPAYSGLRNARPALNKHRVWVRFGDYFSADIRIFLCGAQL